MSQNIENSDKGYVDMHCHIIPHVDDGARTSRQAIKMISIAYENGIRTMIATPHYEIGHYDDNKELIIKNFNKIKKLVATKYPDFKIYLGNEIFFSYGVVENLDKGDIFSMAGSGYVLVEFSPNDSYNYIRKSLNEIINGGYIPILAHVERYEEVISSFDNVEELVDAGAYMQVNARTMAGNMGIMLRRKVLKLIKNDLIHFISTDTHSDGKRSPDLSGCLKYLNKKLDKKTINRLLRKNAIKVINNQPI